MKANPLEYVARTSLRAWFTGVENKCAIMADLINQSDRRYRYTNIPVSKAGFGSKCCLFRLGLSPFLVSCLYAGLALAPPAFGSTTVYLPAPGALNFLPVGGASNATPIVLTITNNGLSNGAPIWCRDRRKLAANGFFIASGVTANTVQLTYMYFGGPVTGSGAYTGGGQCTQLTAYTLAPHPRLLLDGPSGALATSLQNTSSTGPSNAANPPYAALAARYSSYWASNNYQATNADQPDMPWCCYGNDYAIAGLLWYSTQNSTQLAVAKWGIDHVEQMLPSDNFYCAGDQCGNSDENNYASGIIPTFQSYSMIHGQLTAAEIQNFKDKILNDNDFLHNGVGGNASSPLAIACSNTNWSTWVDANNYCGWLFYDRYLTYAPTISPGQEGHYTADYIAQNPTAVGPGFWDQWPHGDNLTLSKLAGYIAAGIALADDDVRAQMLLTQAYTYYYAWYWAYAESGWTPRNQGSRYTSFNVGTFPAEIAEMMKNSGGPNITGGNYLKNFLPFVLYQSLPDFNPAYNYMDQWGDVYVPDTNAIDWASVISIPLREYNSSPYAAAANYWLNKTVTYTAGQFGGESFAAAMVPYLAISPSYAQTSVTASGLGTQYLFKDTDYANCMTAFGSTANSATNSFGCYPNTVYGGAISKSDWTSTATQVNVQASYNADNYDHSGCGTFGSYHIYRKDYLLSGDASGANTAPNGAAHADCTGSASTDILIELGGGDNWLTSAPVTIPRWGSTDPTGDTQSRYMYMLMDLTGTYQPSMNATRVNRSLIHFKKSGTQDYVVAYDDVALSSATQIQDWMMYWTHPASGTQNVTASASSRTVVSANATIGNFLGSSFLPVAGSGTVAMVANGVTGTTNRQYLCPSTNGSSCNTSATALELVAVHKPSTNSSDSMPAISQPACTGTGGNCVVANIQDASYPKVAVFARQGVLLTAVSFTSSHSGTAQYVVAGLQAGSYAVTVNGSALSGSPFTAAANDSSLYFESTAGPIQVTQSGTTGTPPAGGRGAGNWFLRGFSEQHCGRSVGNLVVVGDGHSRSDHIDQQRRRHDDWFFRRRFADGEYDIHANRHQQCR